MEIINTQMCDMTFCESELLGKHKVSHRCPHNLQAFKAVHFIQKQHPRKTISKMGPEPSGRMSIKISIIRGLGSLRGRWMEPGWGWNEDDGVNEIGEGARTVEGGWGGCQDDGGNESGECARTTE